ncbi:1545_t:CDS:2, partial [Ambispora leptoticha]
FFKKIAYDQIKQALTGSSPSLEESDLSLDSQNDIRELTNEGANGKVKDEKTARKIRDNIFGEIEKNKLLFEDKKVSRELFIEEISEAMIATLIKNDEDWEKLEKSFIKITDEEGIEVINVESVVAAVKNLVISKLKGQIEEKILHAKMVNEQEERNDEEKEALREKEKELCTNLELLKYGLYLSTIQKATKFEEINKIEDEIRENVKGNHLPPEKPISNLYQALKEQEIVIKLRGIINSNVPANIEEINEQLEQLNKLSIQATKAEQKVYNELKKEVDDKELELMKVKHQQANGEIEKHFKFRTDFYKVAEIIPSPENNHEINEEGFASLNGINYLYYVWDISRLQAEIMQELQDKIDEARGKIDTSAPEDRTSLLRELQNFNEQWVEESENESIKKARKGALVQKKSRLENVIGELFGREIQSI